ncbi:MAG: class I SAM-dependent methyltransferase [Flavobacteriaceae bacterium]|jgi:ubiquinone/menaquinone biosynthesis C-methylase UbiE|nr:class I SAM-dependent methyltransferase [Flavobacteriaceae bacterium]
MKENYIEHNEGFWNKQAQANQQWSMPVNSELTSNAKQGDWEVYILPSPLEKSWLGDIKGKRILCLASAGGQQAPILAAAGGIVTVFDLSEGQLEKDKLVAERDNLTMQFVKGDMMDLSCFDENSFDIIVHPISNLYVEDVTKVWNECYRVLVTGGRLLSSFYNPIVFVGSRALEYKEKGMIKPMYKIPYADRKDLTTEELQEKIEKEEAIVFGHSLQDLIGGQLQSGFYIKDFKEDWQPNPRFIIDNYIPTFIATLAIKF